MKRIITLAFAAMMMLSLQCCQQKAADTAVTPSEYTTPNPEGMQTVCDFLKKCGTYYIATMDGDQPRVRPFGTANIFEGKLYIQTSNRKRISEQIAANPKVEICAFDGGEWIRIATTLVNDDRIEAKTSMLDNNPSLKGMYKADDDITQVLFMTNSTAYLSSFSAAEKTIEF